MVSEKTLAVKSFFNALSIENDIPFNSIALV